MQKISRTYSEKLQGTHSTAYLFSYGRGWILQAADTPWPGLDPGCDLEFSDDSLIDLTGQREKMVRHLACTIISSAMVNKSIKLFSFGALELNKLYVLYCIVMFSR